MDFFRDEDIKHYGKILLIGIGIFLIGGVVLYFIFRPNHQIVLKTDTIEYGENLDGPAKLIDRIGKTSISSSNIRSSTTIKLDQYEVNFDKIDTNILGEQKIIAKFSDREIKPQTLIINIVDTTSPEILINDVPEEVELAYIQSEEYKNNIFVRDNYSPTEDIELAYIFSQKPDYDMETELMIVATDGNGNKSETSHFFIIKEDPSIKQEEIEKEQKENSEINSETSTNGSMQQDTAQPIAPPTAIPEVQTPVITPPPVYAPQPQPQRPSNKVYMFSDGYDMQSAPSACQSDLMSSGFSGACLPIQDEQGIYKGMQLIFD